MPRVIHVVTPAGTRFEYTFADGTPDEKIVGTLAQARRLFGTVKTKPVRDPQLGVDVPHEDRTGGDVWDDPATLVVEVRPGPDPVEVKRLRGPAPAPAPAPVQAAAPAPVQAAAPAPVQAAAPVPPAPAAAKPPAKKE